MRLSLTGSLCCETLQLVGVHQACPRRRKQDAGPGRLLSIAGCPGPSGHREAGIFRAEEAFAAPVSGADVLGLPHVGPRMCLEGHQLSGWA